MQHPLIQAALEVFSWPVLLTILASAIYGTFVGAIPGLTATMAVALLVPLTFFLSDVQAIAAIVTTVTLSIFAGDLPAALVRIPGTPASAAYAGDLYALTRAGQYRRGMRISLVFSLLGGMGGTVFLVAAAPQLARVGTQFTSYEYFWLFVLGLTCGAVVSEGDRLKGALSLLLGLLLSAVGLGTDYSVPRLTFGIDELVSGINFVPAMIGLFGMSEVLRNAVALGGGGSELGASAEDSPAASGQSVSPSDVGPKSMTGEGLGGGVPGALVTDENQSVWRLAWRRKFSLLRSSVIGAFIGMLPGAGADIAAWIAYAVSKRFSRSPERYGHGSVEGIADGTGANNAALGGAWIPALVFGIPGDSVTAIAIGVLLMKNITPGPDIFTASRTAGESVLVFSVYVTFVVANIVLWPVGLLAIRTGGLLIRVPRRVLLPLIVLFCIIGSYAMNASYFDVGVMLAMGLVGFVMERLGFPLAPVVLGLILGGELEHKFLQCVTKDASVSAFLSGGISWTLAAVSLMLWVSPAIRLLVRQSGGSGRQAV
jgi:TctA family transporter